jgi:hypothetical protein
VLKTINIFATTPEQRTVSALPENRTVDAVFEDRMVHAVRPEPVAA